MALAFLASTANASLIPRAFGNYRNGGWDGGSGWDAWDDGAGDRSNPRTFFNGQPQSGESGAYYPLSLGSFENRNIDFSKAATARIAHAALAASAFVFFFPVGAMAMRLLPGRLALVVHALCQLFAFMIFIAAAGIGLWMCVYIRSSDFDLTRMYHPIIGIVIFCLLFIQPIGGILHHMGYKRHGGRTGISYLHIWLGRLLITFGMINGGLGLMLANNASRGKVIAYGVVAGIMWVLWVLTAIFGRMRRTRRAKEAKQGHVNGSKGVATDGAAPVNGGANGVARAATPPPVASGAADVQKEERFA